MKLKIPFISLCLLLLAVAALPQVATAQQSRKMTEKFFPDPDVEINTPSFAMKGFVGIDGIMEYINARTAGKSDVIVRTIGFTQKGVAIPAVVFSKKSKGPRGKVMLTARVHGDEPGGTEAMLYLIDRLINDPEVASLRDKLDIAIVPIVNIDGGARLERVSANGLDLNRDMTKLATPENIALRKFFTEFSPDVILDLHEYNPFRADYLKYGRFGVTAPADAMFLYCENPNYQEPLRAMMSSIFLPALKNRLAINDLTYSKYFTSAHVDGETILNMGGASPRSSSSAFGLSNTVSLLLEVRGAGLGKTGFKHRVNTAYLVAFEMLNQTAQNVDIIQGALADAITLKSDIVVTQRTTEEVREMPFIDIQRNEMITVEVPVRDVGNRKDWLVRPRPTHYIILPEYANLAEKLTQLGIEVTTLPKDRRISAQSYVVTSYSTASEKFEGFYEQNVRTKVVKKSVVFPRGSFVVDMNQRNSNLAAVVLEPEAANGFVRYCVLPTQNGAELPIYRIVKR